MEHENDTHSPQGAVVQTTERMPGSASALSSSDEKHCGGVTAERALPFMCLCLCVACTLESLSVALGLDVLAIWHTNVVILLIPMILIF